MINWAAKFPESRLRGRLVVGWEFRNSYCCAARPNRLAAIANFPFAGHTLAIVARSEL
ncbi:MAG: hypothetical protein ABSH56_30055 [Bryobacteraceae bacterium]